MATFLIHEDDIEDIKPITRKRNLSTRTALQSVQNEVKPNAKRAKLCHNTQHVRITQVEGIQKVDLKKYVSEKEEPKYLDVEEFYLSQPHVSEKKEMKDTDKSVKHKYTTEEYREVETIQNADLKKYVAEKEEPKYLGAENFHLNQHNVSEKKESKDTDKSVKHKFTAEEYREDILIYLMELELKYTWPQPSYMQKQKHLTPVMRSVLVDWLVSVAGEYKIGCQTLHLSVNYIDRFLGKMLVVTNKFQLLGVAALLVSSKMEEIYPIDVKELVYLSGDCYSIDQVLKMERLLLKVLTFDLQPPTMFSFVHYLCIEHKLDEKTLHLAMFLCELVLLEGTEYYEYLPSKLAAASIALARLTLLKRNPWPKKLAITSGYSLLQLSPVLQKQNKSFTDSPNKSHKAIISKYASDEYHEVAKLQPRNLEVEFSC